MKKLMGIFVAGVFAVALAMPVGLAFADGPEQESGGGADNRASTSGQIVPFKNNTDEAFTFTFTKVGATAACNRPRTKDDWSAVYVKVNVKTCDRCRAYVDQNSSGSWVNVTAKGKATIKGTGQFGINVCSPFKAGSQVRLTGWADSTTGKVSGVWSPDTLGSFTSINGN